MEKNDTEELLLEGSEIKMNEDICSYEKLHKFPRLCTAMQLYEEAYEENSEDNWDEYYCHVPSPFDVQELLKKVQWEIQYKIPLEDYYKISYIIDLTVTFLYFGCSEIDVILHGFNEILREHMRDTELFDACEYILEEVTSFTYQVSRPFPNFKLKRMLLRVGNADLR